MSTPLGKNSHICDSHCEKFDFETLVGDSHKIFLGSILGDIGKTEFEILWQIGQLYSWALILKLVLNPISSKIEWNEIIFGVQYRIT